VAFDIEVADDAGTVLADPDLIRATVLNLLLNAAQAINGQGTVRVTNTIEHGMWTITVADHGPGVPVDIRAQILEPFFTTKARGGGLGLPVAKRVAELHGGTLTMDFPASGGTSVRITAPVQPRPASG
jgi:signal transduction histidine kinase